MVKDTQGAMFFLGELGGMAVKYLNIFAGMDLQTLCTIGSGAIMIRVGGTNLQFLQFSQPHLCKYTLMKFNVSICRTLQFFHMV